LSNERAILIEPLAVIVHALKKVNITKDTSVAVVGCGTEGMLSVALANYLGGTITAIDINPDKLIKVKQHYPDIATVTSKDVNSNDFDIVLEVAGAPSAFEQCVDIVKPGGSIIAIGLPEVATIPVVKMVRKEITIYGSIIYNVPEDFLLGINYLLDDTFNVEAIISKIIPVNEFKAAYEKGISGKYHKIL